MVMTKILEVSWPLEKLLRNFEVSHPDEDLAVLLSTGSFNPLHWGHIGILECAARLLEASGTTRVIAGFLSPSSDIYLSSKSSRKGLGWFLPSELRVASCGRFTANHPWIETSGWEADQPHFVDFPSVASHLKRVVEGRLQRSINVYYVCGADLYRRAGLVRGLPNGIGVVVVARENDHVPQDASRKILSMPSQPRFNFQSSTQARAEMDRAIKAGEGWDQSKLLSGMCPKQVIQSLTEHRPEIEKNLHSFENE
jgi:nicotinic acid mononucleotide adenylyltransferase